MGIDDVNYLGAIALAGHPAGKWALVSGSNDAAGDARLVLVNRSYANAGVKPMPLIDSLWENRRRWQIKTLSLSAVLLGFFIVAANRAQASPVQPLSESEVVQQIQRYCTVSWRNASVPRAEWGDCSQQLFCELLQRVPRRHLDLAIAQGESEERRELNRAIWRIIKRHRRSEARALIHVGWRDPSHSGRAKEPDDLLADMIQSCKHELSARQFCIVQMTSEGYTIADIAKHLGITVARVSDEKYRSIRRIRESFDAE